MVYLHSKNPNFGRLLKALHRLDNFGLAYRHLVFLDIGMFHGYLVHIFCGQWVIYRHWHVSWMFGLGTLGSIGIFLWFWYFVPIKIWQPCSEAGKVARDYGRRKSKNFFRRKKVKLDLNTARVVMP
jgi:hypothetical protein